MDILKHLRGIWGNLFKIGGPDGSQLKNNSGVIEIRDYTDSDYAKLRALKIQSSSQLNDVPTLFDLRGRVANIQFSFAGATPPTVGVNAGKYGFVHTSGGVYTAGDVVYDNAETVSLDVVKEVYNLTTSILVSGSISLNQNGSYSKFGSSWVLVGDGNSTTSGGRRCVSIPYTYDNASPSSTTSIPDNSTILKVINLVLVPFNGTAPTISAVVHGTSGNTDILAIDDSDLLNTYQYENEEILSIDIDYGGVIDVLVEIDGSTVGSGIVYVEFAEPTL
jgi:hypothetical protein